MKISDRNIGTTVVTALSRRWSTQPNAPVRPVEAAIHAPRSIFNRRMTAKRDGAAIRCGCAKFCNDRNRT
ncbi:hypothetical protein [Sediminimonas sp.]|uniref:hypothetical protein n=1 Tax=Sediminimonas sp. TaxID=2823379 RepID=UPI0025D55193|nr:hypothetical protein [Sediminimonas sp.]